MQRRQFFTLAAASAALAGCQFSQLPVFSTPAIPDLAQWQALQQQLSGTLLFHDAADFDRLKKAANARYDAVPTAVIIRCNNTADVQHSIRFIALHRLPFAVRSGGHSYTGLSSTPGVLLDIGALDQVQLTGDIASIGAGAKLGDVYATLGQQQRSIPAGSCASVGIAGLVLGGGLGIADRVHGLTCDALLQVELVTADGELLLCDQQNHPELFWALRGGGGGQFGIATRFTLQTFATAPIRNYIGRYPLSEGPGVLANWQRWLSTLPDEVWSQATIWFNGQPDSTPEIQLRVCGIGQPVLVSQQWQRLADLLSGFWSDIDMQDHQYLDFMLNDCDNMEMPQCKLPNQHASGQLKRVAMAGSSDIFQRYLPKAGLQQLLLAIEKRHQAGFRGGVMLTAMGGAIGRTSLQQSVFAHRDALLSAQYLFSGPVGTPETMLLEGEIWVHQMRKLMRRWSTGGAYVNYTDGRLKNWAKAYYGGQYPQLRRIKSRYDPGNLFRFPQSIEPA